MGIEAKDALGDTGDVRIVHVDEACEVEAPSGVVVMPFAVVRLRGRWEDELRQRSKEAVPEVGFTGWRKNINSIVEQASAPVVERCAGFQTIEGQGGKPRNGEWIGDGGWKCYG